MSLDKVIYGDKTFSNLLEEIHINQKSRSNQVSSLIRELKPLIEDIGDATLVVPLIKEYLEIGVKSDDQLIKLASIVQKVFGKSGDGDNFGLTEAEIADLMKEVDNIASKTQDNKKNE